MEPIEKIPNQTSPLNTPYTPKQKIRFSTFLISIIVVAIISGLSIFLWGNFYSTSSKLISNPNQDSDQSLTNSPTPDKSESVLIYAEKISEVSDGSGRLWPTLKILRVVNNGQPEVLVPSIGQVGEMPTDFLISPDKKSLFINLESKLVAIDLATKEVKDIIKFEYGGNYRGTTFSPDGSKLFVWDQNYGSNDGNYSVYTYDLETKEKTALKSGTLKTISMIVHNWRNDNKILLFEPLGEYAELWVFDLNDKSLVKKESGAYWISDNGMLMAVPISTVSDPCNALSGSGNGAFNLIEPVTQIVKDKIEGNGKQILSINISPQGDQIIYSTANLIDPNKVVDISNCDNLSILQQASIQRYLKKLNESPLLITNPEDIIKSWGVYEIAYMKPYPGGMNSYIQNGSQVITGATEKASMQIIAQFLQ